MRQWLGELSTGVKAAGGLAVAIAAIVGLVFLFFPDWAPDRRRTRARPSSPSRRSSTPSPTASTSTGSRSRATPRRRRSWHGRERSSGVQLTVKGYKGEELPLRWYVLDQSTRDIVDAQPRNGTLPNRPQ